ncbi:hypothetical protein EF294_20675 [Gordonia oryzae]|uniref:Mammalian cell entry protein n=1 Tax=Gordonia oryzae TaxID=2487349 RepID=A0A3N4GDW3_9ACTN|nr:hypothetical protein [Gordonia oryzae]RPA56800.1 hypothetical protein EF294_20675 [Gordonia oryzae]
MGIVLAVTVVLAIAGGVIAVLLIASRDHEAHGGSPSDAEYAAFARAFVVDIYTVTNGDFSRSNSALARTCVDSTVRRDLRNALAVLEHSNTSSGQISQRVVGIPTAAIIPDGRTSTAIPVLVSATVESAGGVGSPAPTTKTVTVTIRAGTPMCVANVANFASQ